ncbi:hypothetical protein AB6A40_011425 [Gnathostoma spinigerum]|uniref:Uncharacterized protein n=1 Tax=Gnathostoma spinigerum TaxID=75299 RepID=A0ABD6F2Y3_9BILA
MYTFHAHPAFFSGFGKALLEKCLREGMTVFAGCITQKEADLVVAECKHLGGHVIGIEMDVRDDSSVEKARAYVENRLESESKELHALICNAGIQGVSMSDDMLTIKNYEETMQVNGYGVIRSVKAFKKLIKRSKYGFRISYLRV